MKINVVTKDIDGRRVVITPFPPMHAVRFAIRLGKVGLPGFRDLIKGTDIKEIVRGGLDMARIVPDALSSMAETLDPETFSKLLADILAMTQIDGASLDKEDQINAAFYGDIPSLFRVVYATIEANGFFGLGAIGNLIKAKAPGPITTPAR